MIVVIMDDVDASLRDSFRFSVNLSRYLEGYFEESNYGEGVKELYIGILCKSVLTGMPLEEILDSDKYYKKRKQVECDIYLEYHFVSIFKSIRVKHLIRISFPMRVGLLKKQRKKKQQQKKSCKCSLQT